MDSIQENPDDLEQESPLAALKAAIESGEAEPELGDNPALPLDDISVLPEVFQPRDQGQQAVSDEFHVNDLVKQIAARGELGLDPVVVFWSGDGWVVVDGHHRVEAYRVSEAWDGKPVPVEVFRGNLEAAIISSVELNSKVYLQFDRQERLNAAWRLLCLGDAKQKDVTAATGVSHRQFYKMKGRLNEILDVHPERTQESLLEFTWAKARALDLADIDAQPEYDEDWQSKLAAEWKRRLWDTFGNKITKNPEVFAMAIRELNSGLPQMLLDSNEWSDVRDELLDAWVEEEDNSDF